MHSTMYYDKIYEGADLFLIERCPQSTARPVRLLPLLPLGDFHCFLLERFSREGWRRGNHRRIRDVCVQEESVVVVVGAKNLLFPSSHIVMRLSTHTHTHSHSLSQQYTFLH